VALEVPITLESRPGFQDGCFRANKKAFWGKKASN